MDDASLKKFNEFSLVLGLNFVISLKFTVYITGKVLQLSQESPIQVTQKRKRQFFHIVRTFIDSLCIFTEIEGLSFFRHQMSSQLRLCYILLCWIFLYLLTVL